jgi:uncharacterized protein (DUF433 family)
MKERKDVSGMKKNLGRYVVVDSRICHGEPTFRGTRILVRDVLEQVADGMAWEEIEKQWRGAVNQKAIAEAVRLGIARYNGIGLMEMNHENH